LIPSPPVYFATGKKKFELIRHFYRI
jgi:hypothetical protein